VKLTTQPPSSAEVKECKELYLHIPNTSSWHGAYFFMGMKLGHIQGRIYEKSEGEKRVLRRIFVPVSE
jgi:hypothetical protein